MPFPRDYDLIVVGHETEGCLAAIAARRAGARVALVVPPDRMLGGLLTEGGLAFVDRDSRHLTPPAISPQDGIFGKFLARAGVPLVALRRDVGAETLAQMLSEAGVVVLEAEWEGVRVEGDQLVALGLASGDEVSARHFLDTTPDGDLGAAVGLRFATGFHEVGLNRMLGVSPLPLMHGVSPSQIMETCRFLALDPDLDARRVRQFGSRAFLDLEQGDDYLLIGPPYLGLSFQRWREGEGEPCSYPFEADGFNVAIVGEDLTSWNGLIYFSEDPATLLRLSRLGADSILQREVRHFERFLRTELGWSEARLELPRGVYVRQTRHLLDARHRLTLNEIAAGYSERSVGTFCYYPDFRGFRSVSVPCPLTAHVILDAGLAEPLRNLGLASRSAGYTPFAHSICRLVQYNVSLGAALGVAAAMARDDLGAVSTEAIKAELARHGYLADDPSGLERNSQALGALQSDPVLTLELA